ncbi:MAG: hypothetical protein A2Z31_08020 [candidate division NC10 bacterium RBG_16_65_8]|nr:MAG: hypothetical protein A2Z31_08020 [candidate division NC10 bacterium RBG_16_65_8]
MAARPSDKEFAAYYARYVSLVPESDVLSALESQIGVIERIARSVSRERETYRYAAGKWSIREVFGHLIDGERVFGHRAFCISRGEAAPLPKFDENAYVAESRYNDCALADLLAEFAGIRHSNLTFLRRLTEEDWQRFGTASDNPVSVRALAFIMAGHVRHHLNVLHASYGVSPAA